MNRKYGVLFYTSCVILILGIFLYIMPVQGESDIYSNVLRLHISAASDSERDQSVKLTVRDAVLDLCGEITRSAADINDAQKMIGNHLEDIEAAANSILEAEKVTYRAKATLCTEIYPTRTYEGYTLPRGEYMSLKVTLGSGKGANWWCILFPEICITAAVGKANETAVPEDIMTSLTPQQYKTITGADGRYIIKFKLLELFSALFQK